MRQQAASTRPGPSLVEWRQTKWTAFRAKTNWPDFEPNKNWPDVEPPPQIGRISSQNKMAGILVQKVRP